MRRFFTCSALALALLCPSAASALRAPVADPSKGPFAASGALVSPDGRPPIRAEISTRWGAPPRSLGAAWSAFVADTGGAPWTALWDTATARPLRLVGGSIPAPHASSDPQIALKSAREVLLRHADLLLAGRPATEFDAIANDDDRGLRALVFQQMVHIGNERVPLLGATVDARFKADRLFVLGSSALPVSPFPPAQIDAGEAESAALIHLAATQPGASVVEASLVALPIVPGGRTPDRAGGGVRVHPAWRVLTESASPPSRTEVFVEARSGEILATRELLRSLTGTLHYQAPVRGPQSHGPFPAGGAHLLADNTEYSADGSGQYSFDPAPASLSCLASSDIINVFNAAGDAAKYDFVPQDGASVLWSMEDDEKGDAQISAFVHATIAKAEARKIDPTMGFLDNTLQVRVNQYDEQYVCNAFWNGSSLNFFLEYSFCNNTSRVADVVYHEFGHAFHTHTALPGTGATDPALGEGGADYFASAVTNDPQIAPGFYKSGDVLREIDTDRRWPGDISWDPHETGLIFAGAMWDLRTAFEATLGPDEGPALAHSLYRAALRRAQNIPASYVEILAADDDDGDLANGTPHICEILAAFVPHGLSPYVTANGGTLVHDPPHILPGQKDPYTLTVGVKEDFPSCGSDGVVKSIDIQWRTLGASGTSPMAPDAGGFTGTVPGLPAGSQLRYSLQVKASGLKTQYPQNIADPEYRAFAGDVTPLYCNDFEVGAGDFVLSAEGGKASDFVWGSPHGNGGDPEGAYSGQFLIGTRLENDGLYRNNRTSYAESPIVDTGAHTHARLQFMRWLTVEDGYFDQANILVNGKPMWQNAGTDPNDGSFTHQDLEWRFEDIDLTNFLAGGNHTLQVRFELASDGLTQLGGWNIDDFCIVGWDPPPPEEGGAGGTGGSGGAGGGEGGLGDDSSNAGCACDLPASSSTSTGAVVFGALAAILGVSRRRRGPRSRGPLR